MDYSIAINDQIMTKKFPAGTLLVEALDDLGIHATTPCGGKGICGKCRVRASGALSPVTEFEQRVLADAPGYRLLCHARIEGDVAIIIEQNSRKRGRSRPAVDIHNRYAIAVDIGTTSVQMSLIDSVSGSAYLVDDFLNPQRRYGHDVITRISNAADPAVYASLVRLIREHVFGGIRAVLHEIALDPSAIQTITVAGNTTMLHFFFGLPVASIGVYPFTAAALDYTGYRAASLGAAEFFNASVLGLPSVSSFLGGDLTGGLSLCWDQGFTGNTYFIDLGTNGEMYLVNGTGAIYSTSCAMGPALEGMNIAYGMTADNGAITHVRLADGGLAYTMIGDGDPIGITGTALIDLVSIFLRLGLILPGGAFAKDFDRSFLPAPVDLVDENGVWIVKLWNGIGLNQRDIRNVQLAKGASLAATKALLAAGDIRAEEIDTVLIAGAFSTFIDLDHFNHLNFLPHFPNARYQLLGNTSLRAAETACRDRAFFERTIALRDRVTEIELSLSPGFNEDLVMSMMFE